MAKRRKKKKKATYETARNYAAVAANFRATSAGGGAHGSKNTKRNRTRKAQKEQAINDGW